MESVGTMVAASVIDIFCCCGFAFVRSGHCFSALPAFFAAAAAVPSRRTVRGPACACCPSQR